MPALSAPALDRFVKLCGLLTSEHDGERATAARMASDLLRQHRLTWAEVLTPAPAQARSCPACAARSAAPRRAAAGSWRKTLATLAELAVRRPSMFTTWERAFICNLLDRRTISKRQREILAELAEKAGAC
jgi:hypothetical protein